MIRTAVILAAGLGSRLGKLVYHLPKGFLEFDGVPIVEQSIVKLIESGIDNIIIGTGHAAGEYERMVKRYPQVQCKKNPLYMQSGSMYTLYCLKELIDDDFLLLESDIIYDRQGIWTLLNEPCPDIILASGETQSGDEVYIETDKYSFLRNMSKEKKDLEKIFGELVGITKISFPVFKSICAIAERYFSTISYHLEYETALTLTSGEENFYVKKIEDLAWCEIDNQNHLERAQSIIYPLIRQREELRTVKRNILLTPGPATTRDSIKYAQVVPDICPREIEFGQMLESLCGDLTQLIASTEDYATVLFGGSGTAAVESVISSALRQGTTVIINNGHYGQRACEIAKVYKLDYLEFQSPWDAPVDLIKLEELLQRQEGISPYLFVVHNETTTGLLSDLGSIGSICDKYGIALIVDAVSSFGAVPIDMQKMNIAFLMASSNKCLQGIPGVSFVVAAKEHLEKIKKFPPLNYYLDLYSQYEYFLRHGQFRFTPPVQTLYALRQAVIETLMEGMDKRYERYIKLWEILVRGLKRLGLKHLVSKENHSKIITAVITPNCSGFNFTEMHDYFYRKGITVYPGKVDELNTFRVANIGDITTGNIERFLDLLAQYLKNIGYAEKEPD